MMTEVIKNFAFYSLFASVYLPLVMAYVFGGFKNLTAELKKAFAPVDDSASDLINFGEADDP